VNLLMTLVVRDEADVVDAQIAFHLNAGVDFVIATDHDSRDGTAEILESYAREGHLRLIRENGPMKDSHWRTRMARMAASEYGADWVINCDADEFWMPRGGSLKEMLVAVPPRFGVVWALTQHFVPRPDDGAFFAERMIVRVHSDAAINDPTSPFRPHAKAAHRADEGVVVQFGAHSVVSGRLVPFPEWHPADVHHFPFRSLDQYQRKTVRRARGDKALGQYVKGLQASEEGRVLDVYRTLIVDDEALARGLAGGSLVLDARLRDALRAMASDDGQHVAGSTLPLLGVPEQVALAVEADVLREANVVRLQRRLDEVRAREAAFAQRIGARATARGRRRR
jgi:hypothetical protein